MTYLLWTDSMYYCSELEHIIGMFETEEDALQYMNKYHDKYYHIDERTYVYSEGYLDFNRSKHGSTFYLTMIPNECEELYILQCVLYDGSVTIYFDEDEYAIKRELESWFECSKVKSRDDRHGIHYVEMNDGKRYDIYEYVVLNRTNV